jgi:hypothetical protein
VKLRCVLLLAGGAVCSGVVAGHAVASGKPQAEPPAGYRQRVLLTVGYGDSVGKLSVAEPFGDELPFGPARVFEDTKGKIYVYDFNTSSLKTFLPRKKPPGFTSGSLKGLVEEGPGVLLVDKQGNGYFYCGCCDYGKSAADIDHTNIRKVSATGKVIYDIGLWNPKSDPPGYALVVYKGGRDKGISKVIPLANLAPEGVDPGTARPESGTMITFGDPFAVDDAGSYVFPITWERAAGQSVGETYVKVDPTGDNVKRVPGHVFDGQGRYYLGVSESGGDRPTSDGFYSRVVTIADEDGNRISSRALKLPVGAAREDSGKGWINGTWLADDSGWLCYRELAALGRIAKLESGVIIDGEHVIHVFDPGGNHVGMGHIPAPFFDVEFEPTIDRDGNIYFLNFRDHDIQVIKWEKISKRSK